MVDLETPIDGSSLLPQQVFTSHGKKVSSFVNLHGMVKTTNLRRKMTKKALSGPTSSEIYSNDMTQAIGAGKFNRISSYGFKVGGSIGVLHELGMNYNFIRPDLIVGSCLQTPEDVDKLRSIGVKTIFCLQQDPDLEYFGVDISAIREYAKTCDNIQHLRAEIRDFDSFDLRMRLPAAVSKLYKAINRNGGITYIHCTAGLGRAPSVARLLLQLHLFASAFASQVQRSTLHCQWGLYELQLAYMFWVQGYKFSEAHSLLQCKRSCFPKLDGIKSATADIVTGLAKKLVTLAWDGYNCSSVEISGLDIGWWQRIPLKFVEEQGSWILERELLDGCYEYKYIIDGEWACNKDELVTFPNKDGQVNNYVQVFNDDPNSISAELQKRLTRDDFDLSKDERLTIRRFLEAYPEDHE
ncbi:hypothetical protein HHK36_016702 [Tetracentron sinense]|uniref:Tyrosine specific protein phosphatases domain-containing protein n=1 Tax=Tetracentron sinense TaxID=13715 RepID=A0A834Z175_TETSI|nr:hypothetical protein HHK36_016702 [Tetracentron sinense]